MALLSLAKLAAPSPMRSWRFYTQMCCNIEHILSQLHDTLAKDFLRKGTHRPFTCEFTLGLNTISINAQEIPILFFPFPLSSNCPTTCYIITIISIISANTYLHCHVPDTTLSIVHAFHLIPATNLHGRGLASIFNSCGILNAISFFPQVF